MNCRGCRRDTGVGLKKMPKRKFSGGTLAVQAEPTSKPEASSQHLSELVSAFGASRHAVRNARTRAQFLMASADLWEIEQALDEAAAMLLKGK